MAAPSCKNCGAPYVPGFNVYKGLPKVALHHRLHCDPCRERLYKDAEDIVKRIADQRGIAATAIYSSSHKKPIVSARRWAVFEIRLQTGLSWIDIGILLNRHHATVIGLYKQARAANRGLSVARKAG